MSGPAFRLEHVVKRHEGVAVLDIRELEIERGRTLCLVGPTGSGKSTLLRILAGVETMSSGKLALDGHEVGAAGLSVEQRRSLTLVFQKPILLGRTVRANVAYGLDVRGAATDGEAQRAVDASLERLGLSALAERRARSLSGGESYLVALARALVLDVKVLMLDEPTANLDPARVTLVEKEVRRARESRGMTVVWATHNLFQARRCADRVALLLDGRIVETGATKPFFDAPQDERTRAFVRGEMIY